MDNKIYNKIESISKNLEELTDTIKKINTKIDNIENKLLNISFTEISSDHIVEIKSESFNLDENIIKILFRRK